MNHVTYETALRLKEAGFQQPAPEAGQFWYLPIGGGRYGIFCCYAVDVSKEMPLYLFATSIKKDVFYIRQTAKWQDQMDSCFFAPAAADILRELPGVDIGFYPTAANGWVIFDKGGMKTIVAESPAEAAAQEFLNLKTGK